MTTLKLKTPSRRMKPAMTAEKFLRQKYPDLFAKCVPLALHIHKQLRPLPDGVSMKALRRFLQDWCGQRAYLKAVAKGGPRYGVSGPDGKVTPKQIQFARWKLRKLASVEKPGIVPRQSEKTG